MTTYACNAAPQIIAATGATGALRAELLRRYAHTSMAAPIGLQAWALVSGLQEPRLGWRRDVRGVDIVVTAGVVARHCGAGACSIAGSRTLRTAHALVTTAVDRAVGSCRSLRYRGQSGVVREALDRARVEGVMADALGTWAGLAADAIGEALDAQMWRRVGREYDAPTHRPWLVYAGTRTEEWGVTYQPVSGSAIQIVASETERRRRVLQMWRPRYLAVTTADVRSYVRDHHPRGSSDLPLNCCRAVNRAGYLTHMVVQRLGVDQYVIGAALPTEDEIEADAEIVAHCSALRQALYSARTWADLAPAIQAPPRPPASPTITADDASGIDDSALRFTLLELS